MNVTIYRDSEDMMDVSDMMVQGGLPRCTVIENRPGMATLTLVNDYQKQGHNLVSDCNLWASGVTEPIRCGMFVQIVEGSDMMFEGWITTITSHSETVDIEVGDGKAFLGRQGTWIRRNFYGANAQFLMFNTALDGDMPYIDISGVDGVVDTNQVYWNRTDVLDVVNPSGYKNIPIGDLQRITFVNNTSQKIAAFRLRFCNRSNVDQTFSIGARMYKGSRQIGGGYYRNLVAPASSSTVRYYELDFRLEEPQINEDLTVLIANASGSYVSVYVEEKSSGPCVVTSASASYKGCPSAYIEIIEEEPISVSPSSNSSRIYPAIVQDWMRTGSMQNRARAYVSMGDVIVSDIMKNIADALGRQFVKSGVVSPTVSIARIGGGYALDYLQAMASVADANGRTMAFTTSGQDMTIIASDCHHMGEAPTKALVWGGSYTGGSDQVAFASFDPSMTLKNRPSLVTFRATSSSLSSDARPIMATVEDVASSDSRGMVVETVASSTSVASDRDAVREAYGVLVENNLDSWEGSMVLPGILSGFIPTSGPYAGSGIVVSITDPRNGIQDYKARVRQVRHDWNSMTTTLSLGNLDEAVVNRISDTIAMASKGNAEAFAAASPAGGFNAQYLRMRVSGVSVGDSNTVYINIARSSGNDAVLMSEVSVGVFPDGSKLLQASAVSFLPDVSRQGVWGLTINGTSVSIPTYLRPDFLQGQTLTVSLTIV